MSDDTNVAQAFAKLLEVVTELRARCPWDREQKLGDTPRHLIEETYEVADAIARGNLPDVAEELGDVIVQCLFIGVILAEDVEARYRDRHAERRGKTNSASSARLR